VLDLKRKKKEERRDGRLLSRAKCRQSGVRLLKKVLQSGGDQFSHPMLMKIENDAFPRGVLTTMVRDGTVEEFVFGAKMGDDLMLKRTVGVMYRRIPPCSHFARFRFYQG
jgi:hypothetical protein